MVSWFRRKKPDAPERAAEATQTDIPTAPETPAIPASPAESGHAGSEPVPAPAGKLGWMQRVGKLLNTDVAELLGRNPVLDDDLLDEIETALITADVGVTASTELVEKLRKRMKAREFADAGVLLAALRAARVPVEDLEIGRADLEDVFMEIMQAAPPLPAEFDRAAA